MTINKSFNEFIFHKERSKVATLNEVLKVLKSNSKVLSDKTFNIFIHGEHKKKVFEKITNHPSSSHFPPFHSTDAVANIAARALSLIQRGEMVWRVRRARSKKKNDKKKSHLEISLLSFENIFVLLHLPLDSSLVFGAEFTLAI